MKAGIREGKMRVTKPKNVLKRKMCFHCRCKMFHLGNVLISKELCCVKRVDTCLKHRGFAPKSTLDICLAAQEAE